MAEWHLIDDTDSEIQYSNPSSGIWRTVQDTSGQFHDGTYHINDEDPTISFVTFSVQFRGTGIRVNAGSQGDGSCLLYMESGGTGVDFSCAPTDGSAVGTIIERIGLGDGDHQATFSVTGQVIIDSIEILSNRGRGFELQSIGTHANDVPSEALLLDNTDPSIQYIGNWIQSTDVSRVYQYTESTSTETGASFSIQFTGTAIWWYGNHQSPVFVSITLDGEPFESTAVRGNGFGAAARALAWSTEGLELGEHTLVVTKTVDDGSMNVDFFRILETEPEPSSTIDGVTESATQTSTSAATSTGDNTASLDDSTSSQGLSAGVIAGVVIGILALLSVIVVLFLWLRQRRSSQKSRATGTEDGGSAPHITQEVSQGQSLPPSYGQTGETASSPADTPLLSPPSPTETQPPAYVPRAVMVRDVEAGRMHDE